MGISVGMGFRVGANSPADEKLIVSTYADLEAMPTIERWLGKPAIYVQALDKSYYLPYPAGGLAGQPQEYYMANEYWKLAEGQDGFETFPAIRVATVEEFLDAVSTLHTSESGAVGGWIILTANITLTANRSVNLSGITVYGNGHAIDFGLVRWYNSLPDVYVLTLEGSSTFNNVIFRGNVQLETDPQSQHIITLLNGASIELMSCRFSHVIGSDSDTHPVIKMTGTGTTSRIKLYNTESSTNFTVSSSRLLYDGLGIEVSGTYQQVDIYFVDFMGAEPPAYAALVSQVHLFGSGSVSIRKVLHHDGTVTVASNTVGFEVDNTSRNIDLSDVAYSHSNNPDIQNVKNALDKLLSEQFDLIFSTNNYVEFGHQFFGFAVALELNRIKELVSTVAIYDTLDDTVKVNLKTDLINTANNTSILSKQINDFPLIAGRTIRVDAATSSGETTSKSILIGTRYRVFSGVAGGINLESWNDPIMYSMIPLTSSLVDKGEIVIKMTSETPAQKWYFAYPIIMGECEVRYGEMRMVLPHKDVEVMGPYETLVYRFYESEYPLYADANFKFLTY